MIYQNVVKALSLVSGDLSDIATQTQEHITLAQAEAAHDHLGFILDQLILATRISALALSVSHGCSTARIRLLPGLPVPHPPKHLPHADQPRPPDDAKKIPATYRRRIGRKLGSALTYQATATYLAATTQEMSEFWAGQIENLETTAELFFRLVDEKEGRDVKHPEYEHLRATRLQLRFAQDLVTAPILLGKGESALCKEPFPEDSRWRSGQMQLLTSLMSTVRSNLLLNMLMVKMHCNLMSVY